MVQSLYLDRMSWIFIGFLLSSIFGAFSLCVYGIVWWTLFRHWKTFKAQYFQLFIISSFLNVVMYLVTWPVLRLPNVTCKNCVLAPFFRQEYFTGLTTLRFILRYCTQLGSIMEVAMALNRFTAIAFYKNHSKIWSHIFYPVVALVLLIPISLSYNSYLYDSYGKYDNVGDNYYYTSKENPNIRSKTLAYNQLVCSIFVLTLGTGTVYFLLKNKKIPKRSLEIKLFIHSVVNFLTMLSLVLFAVLYNMSVACAPDCWYYAYSNHIQQYIFDIQNLTSPYALIICCTALRRRVPIWRKKGSSTIVSSIFVGFVISSIYGFVSVLVYASVWWVFYNNWHIFKTPYFILFILASILNVISYLTTWPLLRLPNVTCHDCLLASFFSQEYFFGLTTLRFILRYCTQLSSIIEVAMAFNRFTAIVLYVHHRQIWQKILLPVILLVLLIPVGLSYRSYTHPSFGLYDPLADNYYYTSKEDPNTRSLTLAYNQLICSILVLSLGTTTIMFLCKHKKIPQRTLEIKLFVHSIVSFLIMLSLVAFAVIYNMNVWCAPDCWYYVYSNHIQQYIFDLQNLASPYNLTGYLTTWPLLHLPNVICKDCWLSSVYKQKYIVWLTPIRFIFRYCTQLSSISEVALAFNRFTAIAFHLHHRKLWKRILVPVVVAILIIPVSLSYRSFTIPSYCRYDNISDNYYCSSEESQYSRSLTLAINQLFSSILELVLGSATIFFLKKHKKVLERDCRTLEVKLFFHSLVNSLIMLIMTAFALLHFLEVSTRMLDICQQQSYTAICTRHPEPDIALHFANMLYSTQKKVSVGEEDNSVARENNNRQFQL